MIKPWVNRNSLYLRTELRSPTAAKEISVNGKKIIEFFEKQISEQKHKIPLQKEDDDSYSDY